ncbi:hypothetical protein Val02_50440 [Virgisporangium aliadipatigenens]|uniref:Thiol reductant ABC exporter subunit CydD n=1 Tax=Virgisporangium aliadipatigenens TaxID=741659 RepID=A0A8J3YQX3_9ACTN|nr:thiol reductant ABC exporter subunit CydD [Virgisporangium aliadipatigenens]GIJ48158.1 hypothetical protein Val02_50440 [Virgisporangium aliadipatigenens]
MKPLDPRLLRHAGASRGFLILSVVLGVTLAGLVVAQASLLATGITAVFLDGAQVSALGPVLAGLAAVVVARAAVAWAQEVAAVRASAAVKSQLRRALLARLVADGPAGSGRSGELATLAVRGLDALDGYFARYLPQLVLALAVPAVVLTRIAPADLLAAATIVLTLPLIPLFMALVGMHTEATNRRQFRTLARLSHHFLDVVAGLPTLRVFGRARAQEATIREAGEQYRRLTVRTLRVAFLSALVLELLATLSVALVAVGIGLRLVSGELTLHTALVVLILAPEAYLPLRQVGAQFHASAEGLAAANDVFAVLDAPPAPSGTAPASFGAIRFDCVTVERAGRDRPGLPPFSATVLPGEFVALTGPSGCGKSTVLDVLLGFTAPSDGAVTVDGRPLSEVDTAAWRRTVAWLPQRPTLFAGTIRDNIRLGDPHAAPRQVRTAAASAGALEFVSALPNGFDTVLADDGAGLSAGQRQRIALARVFLRDAPLVLLDEPTANLDAETAAVVRDGIRRLAVGRTVIMAAHRPDLIALADRELRVGAVAEPAR